jgi:hypothetical protein
MQAEIWRPVVGFEQYYSVSSFGRVRRDKGGKGTKAGKILKISAAGRNKDGTTNYQTVSFCVNSRITGRNLHAVVAEVFIGPCPEGMEINHKDLDRNNPRADNLEYVTHVTGKKKKFYKKREGKPRSEETKQKLRLAFLGKPRGKRNVPSH